jgi:histidinol-phosphate aminotransferase
MEFQDQEPRRATSKPRLRRTLTPIQPYVPGTSAEDLTRMHAPPRISKLGSNENPLGPGPKALEAVRRVAADLAIYPDASCRELRAALGAATGKSPGNVIVANGSDEVLLLIAAAYLDPGDNVLVGAHTFFNYEFVSRLFDGDVRTIATTDLRHDLAAFARAANARTKLVFLCNPNNPTGLYINHAELAAGLAALPRETLVVVDEAYVEYVDAPDFPDALALMDDFPNLVVVRTFSKAYGLAALRVGYAVAHEAVVADLARVKLPFSVNLVAQKAALAALDDGEHLHRTTSLNRQGRQLLLGALGELGCLVLPSQGNFLCFRPSRSAGEICEGLLRQGVIVRALTHFGLPDWIRVTIGTPEQNAHFVEALAALVDR